MEVVTGAHLMHISSRFHHFNGNREPSSLVVGGPDDETFARPPTDSRAPRGWLVDLIQHFGRLGGFTALKDRFLSPNAPSLSVSAIFALLRPFGLCCEFLTVPTIIDYFLPIIVSS